MGAKLPEVVSESALSRKLAAAGLKRVHQGKVRDTWELPDPKHHNLLLQVATDRVSIFDFVLPGLVLFQITTMQPHAPIEKQGDHGYSDQIDANGEWLWLQKRTFETATKGCVELEAAFGEIEKHHELHAAEDHEAGNRR